jgi:hypothetical protein
MKKNKFSNALLIFCLLCVLITLSSCFGAASRAIKLSKYHLSSLSNESNVPVEFEFASDVNYYMKNDGTLVTYNKMEGYVTGLLTHPHITFDGIKYPIKEIKGFASKGIFYGRYGSDYTKRIVHGKKINIYYTTVETQKSLLSVYLIQQGSLGEIIHITDIEQIKTSIADCPIAFGMMNKTPAELSKLTKESQYLNKVIRIYNNDCNE